MELEDRLLNNTIVKGILDLVTVLVGVHRLLIKVCSWTAVGLLLVLIFGFYTLLAWITGVWALLIIPIYTTLGSLILLYQNIQRSRAK